MATILSCIDSRVPTELVFDLGIGNVFSVHVAGNVIGTKSLASIEYGVVVADVKLALVLGHTHCGAVPSSLLVFSDNKTVEQETGSRHLQKIVDEIAPSVERAEFADFKSFGAGEQKSFVDEVAKRNVLRTVDEIVARSAAISQAVNEGKVLVVGAICDVKSGDIEFLEK